jgi:hypothetical protein
VLEVGVVPDREVRVAAQQAHPETDRQRSTNTEPPVRRFLFGRQCRLLFAVAFLREKDGAVNLPGHRTPDRRTSCF